MSSCCLSHASLLVPNHEKNNTHDCQHRYLWNSSLMFLRPRHSWLPEYYVQFCSSLEAKTHMITRVLCSILLKFGGQDTIHDCQRICLNASPFVWEAICVKDPCISLLSEAGSWLILKAHVPVFYFVESGSSILRFVYAGACWVMRIAQYPKGLHSVKLCKRVNK